jgi:membrane protease YdiL (CAAX protease family)
VDQADPWQFLGLKGSFHHGLRRLIIPFALLSLYFVMIILLNGGEVDFEWSFSNFFQSVILAGLVEEIVFRGFILQTLNRYMTFVPANVITAVLFVCIHFVYWINADLLGEFLLVRSLQVFIVGFIFGFVFRRGNSLWTVVLFHSFYNLGVLLIGN